VVMDTLRADRTSLHGYGKPTTPNLDRLAAKGLSFSGARVPSPWTWPSTASLLTGLEPLAHGVTGHDACYMRHGLTSLPEALQARGFTCAAFSGNPLIVPDKNFDSGFEHFEWKKNFTPGSELLPKALAWISANADKRFFLYLHLVDPHDPHRPLDAELKRLGGTRPQGYGDRGYLKIGGKLRRLAVEAGAPGINYKDHLVEGEEAWIQDSYDACVATGDVYLGQLMEQVRTLQLESKTVIAFTSDHGEELFDHGLTNHAHTLYPELMDVPLVLAGPGIPVGVTYDQIFSNRHLAGTLARLGGTELPVPDGLNLLDGAPKPGAQLFSHSTKGNWNDWSMVEIFGVLEENWSFHWAPQGLPFRTLPDVDPGEGQWRLFNRQEDPTEQIDVSSKFPAEVQRLRAAIKSWRQIHANSQQATGFGAGAATRSLLEGVGYIDVGK
jgi:arylsulfatase A-like enzyme